MDICTFTKVDGKFFRNRHLTEIPGDGCILYERSVMINIQTLRFHVHVKIVTVVVS